MTKTPGLDEVQFYSRLFRDIGALVLVVRGTESQLQELGSRDWRDPELSRFGNKIHMKALGGAIMQYEETYTELMILGMSRVVDNQIGALETILGVSFDVYSNMPAPLRFHRDVKIIRHLGNVIKHNASVINAADGRSAASLVNEFGLPDGLPVGMAWGFTDLGVESDIVVNLYRVEAFCCDLIAQTTPYTDHFVDVPDDDIRTHMLRKYLSRIPGEQ